MSRIVALLLGTALLWPAADSQQPAADIRPPAPDSAPGNRPAADGCNCRLASTPDAPPSPAPLLALLVRGRKKW